ncbi:MAG: electron transfer flavoprotein subunit alpha/FixB family protein [Myxococcota bacterium]
MAGGPVWVVVEEHQGTLASASLELMPEARRLAGRLGSRLEAILLGGRPAQAPMLGAHGVSTVHLLEGGARREVDPAETVDDLARLAADASPALILYAATRPGRELAARTAARLGAGLMSDCARIDVDVDGCLRGQRPVYAGRATATVVCASPGPAMATATPGALSMRAATMPAAAPEVRRVTRGETQPARLRVEGFWRPGPWEMDLGEAEVVVSGGRGVADEESFRLLAELAKLLGGAVAASRPVVDAGIAPYHRQVGLSGRTVAPRLYIACGISGAPHHTIGMRSAEAVIAINPDPYAPIFDLADLGIVAEVGEVVPPVVARLRESREAGASTTKAEVLSAFAGTEGPG